MGLVVEVVALRTQREFHDGRQTVLGRNFPAKDLRVRARALVWHSVFLLLFAAHLRSAYLTDPEHDWEFQVSAVHSVHF